MREQLAKTNEEGQNRNCEFIRECLNFAWKSATEILDLWGPRRACIKVPKALRSGEVGD